MRIPITRDGLSVIVASTLLLVVIGMVGGLWTPWSWGVVGVVWLWVLAFFRDPARHNERRTDVLYAPADGTITEVVDLDDHALVGRPCHRVRIFLSLFNTHINRMPCAAEVLSVTLNPGKFINAMNPRSAEINESNTLVLQPDTPLQGPLVVRQIVGVVARTIVCHAREGQRYDSGQRFGMIRFGSGTELIVPRQPGLEIQVQLGDKVKAGLTELLRIEETAPRGPDMQERKQQVVHPPHAPAT